MKILQKQKNKLLVLAFQKRTLTEKSKNLRF